MDGLSVLDPLTRDPAGLLLHPAYDIGNAIGWLARAGGKQAANHLLSGRLYLSKSGWLLLSVPNALARGVFDALTAPGAELPTAGALNVPNVKEDLFNAHISVMTADEVASIGADKITERGHVFHYGLGPLVELAPKNIDGISKIWAVQVVSPALSAIRKSYGLPPLLHGSHQFHITVAVRRTKVLQNNSVSKFDSPPSRGERKAASVNPERDNIPGRGANCSRTGKTAVLRGGIANNIPDRGFSAALFVKELRHEQTHTDYDQIAQKIAQNRVPGVPATQAHKNCNQKKVAASNNAYWDQLQATPLHYDGKQTLWRNVLGHAQRVKDRGDQQLIFQNSNERFKRYFNPAYAQQQMLRDLGAIPPRPQPWRSRLNKAFEATIQRYGTRAINRAMSTADREV